ncbi:MAG: hypothetical protein ABIH52_00325 [Candidatus Aenigmatarchaeota archaeon]|nr:tyrosine-type recombinase/integrase [Nanoarchaeota archaeon]
MVGVEKPILSGTIRIKSKDLKPYERVGPSWKESSRRFPEAMHVVQLFKAHDNFEFLVDKKNPEFLKGQLSPEGKCQGARVNTLPDGRKLDKAYSLFATYLTMHDEESNDHWDVLYKNPGGTYSYVYTLEKKAKLTKKKYKTVEEFEKYYQRLERNVLEALNDRNDSLSVPMYTLLKTHMRIGNEIYYKAHGHKGLTTLKKADIHINGNKVTFKYKAKNGVPRSITKEFPDIYIERLSEILSSIEDSAFVFINSEGHPLDDKRFKRAFKRYCGKEFYPHIIRSYYATKIAKKFLAEHDSATKKEIRELFTSIAADLGHKKFVKKEQVWKERYNVTIHHYIQPELLEQVKGLVKE